MRRAAEFAPLIVATLATFWRFRPLAGALLLPYLAWVAFASVSMLSGLPDPVWTLSLLNALACTFAPIVMIMMAVERVGPAVTAQTGMIGPLSTIALGVLLLDEPVTVGLLVGTGLVLAGVTLLARSR